MMKHKGFEQTEDVKQKEDGYSRYKNKSRKGNVDLGVILWK